MAPSVRCCTSFNDLVLRVIFFVRFVVALLIDDLSNNIGWCFQIYIFCCSTSFVGRPSIPMEYFFGQAKETTTRISFPRKGKRGQLVYLINKEFHGL